MERPPLWRSTGVVVVVSALAALTIAALTVSALSGRGSHASAPKGSTSVVHPSTTGSGNGTVGTGRRPATHHEGTSTKPTSITVLSPISAPSEFAATYAAPPTAYAVTLTATGQCWVMAKSSASGAVLWTGTMQAGQVQPVLTSGTMTLELGAPSDVAVKLAHDPVLLPATYKSPFTETFNPAG